MSELGVSRQAAQLVLGLLAGIQVVDGIYALLLPRSFYEDFPAGRGWVEALPSYNEHLVRDVGALFLATSVVLIAAAIWLDRRLVLVALVSYLVYAAPHFIYHVLNLGPFSTGDAIAETVILAFTVIAPVWLLVRVLRAGSPPGRPPPRSP